MHKLIYFKFMTKGSRVVGFIQHNYVNQFGQLAKIAIV